MVTLQLPPGAPISQGLRSLIYRARRYERRRWGEIPAGGATLLSGIIVVHPPVKRIGVGASPTKAANFVSGCNVSSRRPPSEGGGRRCNSCHPDHFGWLAE